MSKEEKTAPLAICKRCKGEFQRLLAHLSKKKECKDVYTDDEIEAMKREATLAKKRRYNDKHKAEIKEKQRKYDEEHRDVIKKRQSVYDEKHREEKTHGQNESSRCSSHEQSSW